MKMMMPANNVTANLQTQLVWLAEISDCTMYVLAPLLGTPMKSSSSTVSSEGMRLFKIGIMLSGM